MTNVTMYSRRGCVVCLEAKTLLENKGASVTEIVISGATVVVTAMSDRSDRQGLPQIFIGKTHIGGLESLKSLDTTGRLDWLLKHPRL
jgi:glutaredoxin 3